MGPLLDGPFLSSAVSGLVLCGSLGVCSGLGGSAFALCGVCCRLCGSCRGAGGRGACATPRAPPASTLVAQNTQTAAMFIRIRKKTHAQKTHTHTPRIDTHIYAKGRVRIRENTRVPWDTKASTSAPPAPEPVAGGLPIAGGLPASLAAGRLLGDR